MAEPNEPSLRDEIARLRLVLEHTSADLQRQRDELARLRGDVSAAQHLSASGDPPIRLRALVVRRLRRAARLAGLRSLHALLARRLPVSIGRVLRHQPGSPPPTPPERPGPAPHDPNRAYLFQPGPIAPAHAGGVVTLEQLYQFSRSL